MRVGRGTDRSLLSKRVGICRLVVWAATALIAYNVFSAAYAAAWSVAAFGGVFALLWPLIGRVPTPPADSEEDTDASPSSLSRWIEIGMDILVVTTLLYVSGGFSSPFAPLLFFPVAETYTLLGTSAAISAGLAVALLGLLNLRQGGVTAQSTTLYGLAMGTLLASALLVGWKRGGASSESEERELTLKWPGGADRAGAKKPRAQEIIESQFETLDDEYRQLKKTYQEVAQLNREQRAQLERLRVTEQLFEEGALAALAENEAQEAYARLLRVVTDMLDAGGGALWLRAPQGDTLVARATEGRLLPEFHEEAIPHVADMPPGELRALCETYLLAASPFGRAAHPAMHAVVATPEAALLEASDNPTEERPEEFVVNSMAHPVAVALLREPATDKNAIGKIMGAIGVCDPRGAARFSQQDIDRLQSLAGAFSMALSVVEQRHGLKKRVREISLLYDFTRLTQTATDSEQIYKAIVAHIFQLIPYENCTLFLLDKTRAHLEEKATRGRAVNLLDNYGFEKGQGVSGWVASWGRVLHIPDLTRERNLFNVETIPTRIRSFAAVPLKTQEDVVGVISISHSRPNAFSPEEIEMLNLLAGQAAVTIERTARALTARKHPDLDAVRPAGEASPENAVVVQAVASAPSHVAGH